MLTPEESTALNAAIGEIADEETLPEVRGLGGGKRIPYIGWYWREVDFTEPVSLGRCRDDNGIRNQLYGEPLVVSPSWAGFMENNKWDYPEWTTAPEQTEAIIAALQAVVKAPTQEHLQAAFDVIQSTIPESVLAWDGRTGYDEYLGRNVTVAPPDIAVLAPGSANLATTMKEVDNG